ncbi:metallophosphoesterase [Formivibrio citricus]|uniref:metallophosphoesterase n=1 Tax=Formivibrio citricus TaxID=83765 RepID=UPI0015A5AC7E|nr:metallophosphoesterase [Formivibrio citricus]
MCAAAAYQKASTNIDPKCPDCADKAEMQAVILYPALGTPHVAPDTDEKIRLFLIVEDKCVQEFGINGAEAPFAWYYINTHLRILPFKDAHKTSADLTGKKLYSSPAAAKAGIQVWYKGPHGSEPAGGCGLGWKDRLVSHDGLFLANIRKSAVNLFVHGVISHGLDGVNPLIAAHKKAPQVCDTTNHPLRHLFEIELDFKGLTLPPQPDTMYTLAWMVTCVYKRVTEAFGGRKVSHWEHQDKLVYDFFAQMQEKKQHFAKPFIFDLGKLSPDKWPKQKETEAGRIKPFHPFIFRKQRTFLDIGHLTDPHISCRQFALAMADAAILEGTSSPIGPKLTNGLVATQALFDKFQSGPDKVDAIFMTGDLIDFNRNLAPGKVTGKSPKDQWEHYNLAGNLDVPDYYPRGLDDMLVYSLIKRAYDHNLPVFMVTGNHEAYDEPFGISPRVNSYSAKLAARPSSRAKTVSDALKAATRVQPSGGLRDYDPNQAKGKIHFSKIPDLSIRRANAGIPADHNLTIYEACLIYGPTFPQTMQGWDFMPDNFDWFFTLFTPLADFSVAYNGQRLTGLEWGNAERMLEGSYIPDGLLPRANEAMSDDQLALLSAVCEKNANQHLLFTHFTAVSFNQYKPFSKSDVWGVNKLSDKETYGTFVLGRKALFKWVDQDKITGHFSGHSHRTGAYKVKLDEEDEDNQTLEVEARDPAKQKANPDTKYWVGTNCGGMGVQSLEGELNGWNLMPPAGYLIEGYNSRASKVVTATEKRNAQPRFCVALDYMQFVEEKKIIAWNFLTGPRMNYTASATQVEGITMTVENVHHAKPFIRGVTFYVWDSQYKIFMDYSITIDSGSRQRDTLRYNCSHANPTGLLAALQASKPAFVKVEFNHGLAKVTAKDGANLYNQFNFDDPWIYRVRPITLEETVEVSFDPNGEFPDWKWLWGAYRDSGRYIDPKIVTDKRSAHR